MPEAFPWGTLASGMLLIGTVIAYVSRPGPKLNAVVVAAGAGLLLGSVSFDLVEEALKARSLLWVVASFFLASAVFLIGDWSAIA